MSFLEFTEDEKLPAVTRETRSRKQHARPNYLAALAWALGGLLVAGVLLYIAAPKNTSQPQQLPLTAVSQTEAPPLIEKNVEDIRSGDLVVSYDEATGQQVFNRVVETYQRTSYHLRFIQTRSLETGEVQTFETTDEHPFWQVDVGWVEAGDLAVGDQLLQSNGKFAAVVSTLYESHPEGVTVYNFQVAASHSYYVSAPYTRGAPLLVHNAQYGAHRFVDGPSVRLGGGAIAERISGAQARAIQTFAKKYNVEVIVVGSRVNAGKTVTAGSSDWDYLINKLPDSSPTKKLRDIKKSGGKYLPRGTSRADDYGNTRSGLDIETNVPVDPSLPHIIFTPGG